MVVTAMQRDLVRGGLLVFSAAVVLGAAAPAFAQVPGLDEKRLKFTVTGNAIYDSNVARGSQATADERNIRPDDITYSPRVTVDISLPIGRQALFLAGDVGYDYHQYNTQLDRERISLNGGGQAAAGPCVTALTGGVTRSQSDLADLSLLVTKNTQTNYTVQTVASCQLFAGFGATVGGQYGENRNSAEVSVIDSIQRGMNAGLTYSSRLVGTASLTGSYSTTDYKDRGAPDPFVPDGFKSYGVNLSLVRPIGTRLTGSATLGFTRLESNASGGSKYTGLSGSGSLTYRVNPRLTALVAYNRAAQASLLAGADYQLSESISLQGTYRLGPRIVTTLGGRLSKVSQRGEVNLPSGALLSSSTRSLFGSVGMPVGRKSRVSLTGSYEVRDAKPSLFDYDAYRIGVTASTTF
jgi:hypothetical protein